MRRFGWIPDLPDHRDIRFTVPHGLELPSKLKLLSGCPPIYDQGQEGSCTANAAAANIGFVRHKEGLPYLIPSRQFIYYNTRALEGTTDSDSGASIRDTFKAIASQGVCSEWRWPYTQAFDETPRLDCYAAAVIHKTTKYLSINQTVTDMKSCLAAGYPFVFGISVFDSFMSDTVAQTGVVPIPSTSENMQGGHAILAIGYDDSTQLIDFRNSWGEGWGVNGYGKIPYAYLTNADLAGDFWSVRLEQ